ncbi:hypothetical protein Sxan_15240 [Streptomyces xanthophaeus]|uniref:Uncharacterized protein n=1 Tax=Streptomyces xanthophaeus TaxID=67385 RepID=A0A919GU06_9ACTN|nr:hypothetical protein Sxan_15240 [Streptomyces xanthophaeus]
MPHPGEPPATPGLRTVTRVTMGPGGRAPGARGAPRQRGARPRAAGDKEIRSTARRPSGRIGDMSRYAFPAAPSAVADAPKAAATEFAGAPAFAATGGARS